MTKHAKLAKLRPGLPVQALIDIMGDAWVPPNEKMEGRCYSINDPSLAFGARIDVDGRLGSVSFYRDFPAKFVIESLQSGMTVAAARAAYPAMKPDTEEEAREGFQYFKCVGKDGTLVHLRFLEGLLIGFEISRPGAIYPQAAPRKTYPKSANIKAYDLEMVPRDADRSASGNHGWVFGLPPGITSEQWPLDPISGYPLMHGFTVKLPQDYRVHGPEIVALSFFATASDQNDGGARTREDLYAAVKDANAPPPDNRHLLPFCQQAKARHPRLHRMSDILDYEYAVILLTEAEFNGALCQPPELGDNPYLDADDKPRWMTGGSGSAYFSNNGGFGLGDCPVEDLYTYKLLGAVPEQRLDWNRAILCTPRAEDPNAGIPPEEVFDAPSALGYQAFHYYEGDEISADNYREHAWAKPHKPNHIGGTMRPVQGTPEFSPFYIGFEEYFGGYNFGSGGNAQLDFLEMKIDWACG